VERPYRSDGFISAGQLKSVPIDLKVPRSCWCEAFLERSSLCRKALGVITDLPNRPRTRGCLTDGAVFLTEGNSTTETLPSPMPSAVFCFEKQGWQRFLLIAEAREYKTWIGLTQQATLWSFKWRQWHR